MEEKEIKETSMKEETLNKCKCGRLIEGKNKRCAECRLKFADWMVTGLVAAVCIMALFYYQETKQARDYVNELQNPNTCMAFCNRISIDVTHSNGSYPSYIDNMKKKNIAAGELQHIRQALTIKELLRE